MKKFLALLLTLTRVLSLSRSAPSPEAVNPVTSETIDLPR